MYIIGHKNPDSDSICSAIAYAYCKNQMGFQAIAVRAGEINRETEFILNYFNIDPPKYLTSIKTKVSDLKLDNLECIKPVSSIFEAWSIMKNSKIQLLPVVNDCEKFMGLVSLVDITSIYFDSTNRDIFTKCKTPIINIIKTLNGNLIFGNNEKVIESGKIIVGAMMSDDMKQYINEGDIVITANRFENQKVAIESGAQLLIITGNSQIHPDIYNLAFNRNCFIISTALDTFTTARIIVQSVPIETLMSTENIVSFNADDLIEEIKPKMIEKRHKLYPVVNNDQKVIGGLARYHLISNEKRKVVLLDHNEKLQSINGIEEADIIEIIDHHKIGDIQTNHPIYLRNEPVGSTATIITSIMMQNNILIPEAIAGILCAAIVSDTLKFKSPTCTETDKKLAYYLSGLAKIDIETFSDKMFKAGSTFEGKTEEEILLSDFKEFKIKEYHIGISQLITMNLENITDIKEKLMAYINNIIKKTEYDAILVLITDINKESSELLFAEKKEPIIKKSLKIEGNSIYLKGVVSRKKQLVPMIATSL
ncbi:MAG: inorganic pyrophosphatase [Spirochaetes bacterium GWF1_31_7]|nr:MAG: inorganic pyrophosphatase [Spirochaetes bacterium GWE1_32_154]OHD50829.1 MAG: inorganic pyrophosphatase [Spirochaetes bacterium GWE2_31_10]OHD52767.1 MAG: inorganic pyrophosphatase [Spirochaetes bacterium GWF1_31_7]OHD78559.1 MAG: inorganic pyrophosphatase [Spirochaetes bacterium RIFOXYB1_FULL_32_8]